MADHYPRPIVLANCQRILTAPKAEIDRLVYALYRLTGEEIKIVEGG